MDIKSICDVVSNGSKAAVLKAKKYSPEIFTGAAILFGVGTVVATWFAARKTDKALEEPKKIIATAKSMTIDATYTEADQKHDILLGYKKGAIEIVKLYGPVVLMGASSIACLLNSHRILSNRNAGLIAVNGILTKEFREYRDKVIEKYGKEEDYKLRFGDKMELVEETIQDEDGKETTVVKERAKPGYDRNSFARCFDEASNSWKKDTLHNIDMLKRLQSQLNDELKAKRILTLNDVYELLGYRKTRAGFQYGWVYDPKNEHRTYVDFGLPFEDKEWVHQKVCEGQRNFWLDFNCSEIVWDKLPFEEV